MDNKYSKREKNKINDLAKEYKNKGYSVIVAPKQNDLPSFLQDYNYLPDLIVKSNRENLIIEVKTKDNYKNLRYYDEIKSILENHDNWDFLLVITNPKRKNEEYCFNINSTEILKSFEKVQIIINKTSNCNEVVFPYLWGILEAILRYGIKFAQKNHNSSDIKSLIRDSFMLGIIAKKEYEQMLTLYHNRNLILHGHLNVDHDKKSIEKVIHLGKKILNDIRRTYIDTQVNYMAYLKSLPQVELDFEIDRIISETYYDLINEDVVNSEIASTNAYGWACDSYEIEDINILDNECIVSINFHASGQNDKNKMFYGSQLSGSAEAIINSAGEVYYQDIAAKLEEEM